MSEPFFTEVTEPIAYAGPDSDDPLAFRWYDADRDIGGQRLEDVLRCAVAYWHSFASPGSDVFGVGTWDRPWLDPSPGDEMAAAHAKLEAAFEFFEKLGAPHFCFHDRDIAPEGDTHAESVSNLGEIIDATAAHMERTGTKLLWGTANLFSNPRYTAGAATNPDPEVFAYAAAQLRAAMDATHRLGGENYVLWGGREGYDTLLNTDLSRESDQLGRFFSLVVEHKHSIGFEGTILIEPKPHEPTKHQYDRDVATVYAFLQRYDLENEVKVNVEVNHATLAGHDFHHEIATAISYDLLGSVDANTGDDRLGWDTDEFPKSADQLVLPIYEILRSGGIAPGGFNFDAHLRRQSIDRTDLFRAHISGMDALARATIAAQAMIHDGALAGRVEERYGSWGGELGQEILAGNHSLTDLDDLVRAEGMEPEPVSGRQEELEHLVARYLERVR